MEDFVVGMLGVANLPVNLGTKCSWCSSMAAHITTVGCSPHGAR